MGDTRFYESSGTSCKVLSHSVEMSLITWRIPSPQRGMWYDCTIFFYPLGVVSPVTILFKMFFQCLCEAVGWDAPLTEDLIKEWNQLLSSLQGPESLVIPRCYFSDIPDCPKSVRLIGFVMHPLKLMLLWST